MSAPRQVLFLGHDASRTGAPLLMLEIIKWLHANSTVKPAVILKGGGEIESDYRSTVPTWCYSAAFEKMNQGIHRRILQKLRFSSIRQPNLARLYPPEEYPVVYANTIDTCRMALHFAGQGRRFVHHIHELSYATDIFGATELLKQSISYTDVYIAASRAVEQYLTTTIGVPDSKIHVIHEFPIAVGSKNGRGEARQNLRRQLGLPQDALVVGMCGSPQWRKGTDLFIQLAMHVKRHLEPTKCHFVWLGGSPNSHRESLHDVAQLGLDKICHFHKAVPNPEDYLSAFDLFALTSREDPFSVAMLEAAASGLPIVCFAGAGGAPELVEDDAGIIVPYLDIPAMAAACVNLLLDENKRRRFGDNARAKVQERYALAVQGPKFLAVLEQLFH